MPTIDYDTSKPPPVGSAGDRVLRESNDIIRANTKRWRPDFKVAQRLMIRVCLSYVSPSGHVVAHPRDLEGASSLCRASVYGCLAKLRSAGVLSLVEDGAYRKPSVYTLDVSKAFVNEAANAA